MSFCVVCVLIFNNDNDPFGASFNVVVACAFHSNGMVMFKLQHQQRLKMLQHSNVVVVSFV